MVIDKYTEVRPWGSFTRFTHNEPTTVKILTVNPKGKLSLQFHKNRDEFWLVLEGNPNVTLGENVIKAKPGDEFMINRGDKHRLEAPKNKVKVMEIAFGDFSEEDIIRIEDKYERK